MKKNGKRSIKKDGWKGSLTVEAAAVISLSFFVLGTLILMTLFVHDRAVLQGMICEISSAGSCFAVQEERSEAAEAVRKEIKQTRFLGSRNISVKKDVGDQTASASASAEYPVPGMFLRFLKDGKLEISCSWNSRIQNPGKTIRNIRGAELLIDTII